MREIEKPATDYAECWGEICVVCGLILVLSLDNR